MRWHLPPPLLTHHMMFIMFMILFITLSRKFIDLTNLIQRDLDYFHLITRSINRYRVPTFVLHEDILRPLIYE